MQKAAILRSAMCQPASATVELPYPIRWTANLKNEYSTEITHLSG
jgi:hypothetical protein